MKEGDLELRRAIRGLAPAGGGAAACAEARTLANRLDERGCAYGRVSNARLEEIARGYERVEAKLNAVLLAVTGTFVSTLVGMAVYHLRGS
jgi:hypothetical protein